MTSYSPDPVPWNYGGEKYREEEEKGRRKVWSQLTVYGTRRKWNIPVPNTYTARTLEARTVTLM